MKLALIPPKGLEEYALYSDFHLTLATPDCLNNRTYATVYAKAAERGDFIICDNGANEGTPTTGGDLLKAAKNFQAKEIVLPDVMGDSHRSIIRTSQFLETHCLDGFELHCMAVLHGTRVEHILDAASHYASFHTQVTTIGLPRLLCSKFGHSARIDLANALEKAYPKRFQYHFLGANAGWAQEIRFASKYAPHVRSMDTSMPFNYTLAGVELTKDIRTVINRPNDYFNKTHLDLNPELTMTNIVTMKAWAIGQ